MISLHRLVKSFGGHRVLNGVDVTVPEGGVTALIGPSGGGKSTLLRCVNLLEIPDAGELQVGDARIEFPAGNAAGARIPIEDVRKVRAQTGMVFQNFQLFPHRTVLENVMEGLLTVQRWPRERAAARAHELLDKVGMQDKANAWPSTLSGGQQQRVAIARALAASPRVLLCDEPTSALDPGLAAEVVDVLSRLAREGMTMLMATHDLRLAASIAHEAVFLEDGAVVEAGAAEQIFIHPQQPRTASFVKGLSQDLPAQWLRG
jgi:cystine transport system ATP-binding protein